LVNSAAFSVRNKIGQVSMALSYLGEREIRKWISLIVMMGLSENNPQEVLILSLIRAKFSELLAPAFRLNKDKEALFIMGLFSLMDTLMNQPIKRILNDISLADPIKNALVDNQGPYAPILKFICAYEQGNWETVNDISQRFKLPGDVFQKAYLESLEWSNELNKI
jgi:EAL and modified HD-GYP domain-containing signal transduction protein